MILVTGGGGTLGTRLVWTLRAQGQTVIVCGLEHSGEPWYHRCDIGEYRQLERLCQMYALGASDVVYHLAAEFGRHNGEDFYEQCWRTNVIGTKHLIRLQERHRFRIIFASSSEVYGELDGHPFTEEITEQVPLRHLNDYAISKWVNEQQFRNSMAQAGTETMILRFFNAYGPGEAYHPYRSVVALFIHAALRREALRVYQNYHRTFMYVDDLIATVSRAHQRFTTGAVYNIGGMEYCAVEDVARLVCKEADADPSLIQLIPEFEHNVRNKHPIIDRAVKDLDHRPTTPLTTGIPRTVAWLREN